MTGGLVARAYGIPIAAGFVLETVGVKWIVVLVGGALLMVVPAMAVRLFQRPSGSPWTDSSSVRSARCRSPGRRPPPGLQFVVGLIGEGPADAVVRREAILSTAVTVPLTAASGGLIGILLWFRPGTRGR